MTARLLTRIAVAVAALALAVVLALFAADVLRWQNHLEESDVRFALASGTADTWTPNTLLPEGVSRTVLDVEDDVAFRRALTSFRLSQPRRPVQQFADVTLRSVAETSIAHAARLDPGREQRALLANLRGVLALEEARGVELQRSVLLRRAAAGFREAIAIDPDYEDAKYNLELALRLLQRSGAEAGGGGGERTETPASGAGAASSGRGY